MEQNRESRNRLMHLQSKIFNKDAKIHNGESISLTNSIEKAGYTMQRNEIGPLSHIIYKHQLKMD